MAKKNPVVSEYSEPDDATPEKEASEEMKEWHKRALDEYKQAESYWDDERQAALSDIEFRAGDQWPEEAKEMRKNRPCLTVDKLNQYVRQIVNDGRQNRPAIKVRPVDSGADIATADVFSGIIKHIEERSGADIAYDTALDSAATCGQGYFRVLTEYVGGDSFEQEICIKRIRNPLSVMIDPGSEEADGSDMKFAFIVSTMEKDAFEKKYPNNKPDDFVTNSDQAEWYCEQVRIAEYWCMKEEDRTLYQMMDGSVTTKARLDELRDAGIEIDSLIRAERNIPKRTVYRGVMSGYEWLEEPKEWTGKYIPLLVVWGNEYDIEDKVTHTGIIRPAKDAQRLYNYSRSAFAERVALTPKAPWVAAEGQVEDHPEWETANSENYSVLKYRPQSIGGTLVEKPSRQTASDIPAGFAQDMQISEHDIQGAIGMYNASLGAPSNERSGKAIMARQREGDVGTFHYHDNLNRAIRHCGRILVDLIPKIYDSSRVVRILGYDGTPDDVQIDPSLPVARETQGVNSIYNLGVGTYDVSISSGPSYNTLRQEASESMTRVLETNPELWSVIGDLAIKNMDWPGAQEISERLKFILPPEIKQAEQNKKQGRIPPEMQQLMQQMEQVVAKKDELINAASDKIEQMTEEMRSLKEGNEVKEKEVLIKAADTEIRAYDAETKRMQAVQQAMTPEQIQAIVIQTLADLAQPNTVQMPEPEPQFEMANMPPQGMEIPMETQPNGLGN